MAKQKSEDMSATLLARFAKAAGARPIHEDLDSEDLSDSDRSEFFRKVFASNSLRQLSLTALTGGQRKLAAKRSHLGVWYSSVIFGDLLATSKEESDPRGLLGQRMQALVREALVWLPNSVVAQVVLMGHSDTEEHAAIDCTAYVGDTVAAKNFRAKTMIYVERNGSSAALDIHLRYRHRWWPPNLTSNESKATPYMGELHAASLQVFTPAAIAAIDKYKRGTKTQDEGAYFKQVLGEDARTKYAMCHVADGIGIALGTGGYERVTAHVYVVCDQSTGAISVPKGYERALKFLAGRLAHYYTVHLLDVEKQRLEKQAHALRLIVTPLRKLTNAIMDTQHEARVLTAILFDPIEGIFASAASVEDLFIEGHEIPKLLLGKKVRVAHMPDRYPTSKPEEALWVLANLLSRVGGVEIPGHKKNEKAKIYAQRCATEMIKSLAVMAADNENPRNELAVAVIKMLALNAIKLCHEEVKDYLNTAREILFTPFKADTARLPIRWSVFSALFPKNTKELVITKCAGCSCSATDNSFVVAANANPLATQGHLIAFVSGLVGAHKGGPYTPTLKCFGNSVGTGKTQCCADGFALELSAKKDWFETADNEGIQRLSNLFSNSLNDTSDDGVHGDFLRPFWLVNRRCRTSSDIPVFFPDTAKVSLKFGTSLMFVFEGKSLKILSGKACL